MEVIFPTFNMSSEKQEITRVSHRAGQSEDLNSSQTNTQTCALVTPASRLLPQQRGREPPENGIEGSSLRVKKSDFETHFCVLNISHYFVSQPMVGIR